MSVGDAPERIGPPAAIDGSLDAVADGQVMGWVRNRADPDLSVELEIEVDGEVVGLVIADHVRGDLIDAGIGSGRGGFVAPLDPAYMDGEPHEVVVRAAGTNLELPNSPLVFTVGENRRTITDPGLFAANTVIAQDGDLDAVRDRMMDSGRLAIVAAFRRRGGTPLQAERYVESLRAEGFAVVVVDACGLDTRQTWSGRAELVVRRHNVGWDFASWLAGLHAVRELIAEANELLLTNDSVFGPLFPLAETLDHERVQGADFWGVTDSWEHSYHLQSYFLMLRSSVLRSDVFWRFLARYPFPNAKRQVVHHGEIGLSTALIEAGFLPGATCPYELVARAWLDDVDERIASLRSAPELRFMDLAQIELAVRGNTAAQSLRHVLLMAHHLRRGLPTNQSHAFWDTLIERFRCPFLKRDLVLQNPAEIPNLSDVRTVLAANSDYPIEILVDAARRVTSPRVAFI